MRRGNADRSWRAVQDKLYSALSSKWASVTEVSPKYHLSIHSTALIVFQGSEKIVSGSLVVKSHSIK